MVKTAYQPVPVEAARDLAFKFTKQIVIVASWDRAHGLTHITTYGMTPTDKVNAARGGELVGKALGLDLGQKNTFEDFREVDAAKLTLAMEKLAMAAGGALHLCKSLLAVRNGATDDLIAGVRDALDVALAEAVKVREAKAGA